MALRKIVFFVALSLLVKIAGSEEAAAQKGKAEAQLGSTVLEGAKVRPEKARPEKARPEPKLEQGTRPLQIAKSHPRPPSLASIAAPAGSSAFAPPKYKTSGREFWAVFPSIIGNEDDDANPPKRTLYIASRGRTKVKVKFERRPWEVNVVTVPGQVSVVELPSWGVLRQTQFESVFDLGIKIEAEDDITVYGFSHEGLSSDGWLILPKEALGQHYLVASQRNSMNYPQSWQDAFKPRSTMVIMAVEDGTRIDFRLTATSQSGNLMKDTLYTILLNKGELFPIMARDSGVQQRITYPLHNLDCDPILDGAGNPIYGQQDMYTSSVLGADPDLTGSEVISDKPIVVVSGHERASTPDSNEFNPERVLRDCMLGISRDHLTEQMPPVELWGNEFFVMASRQDRGRTREASDMVRVISATDNNVIEVNGVAIATLNARQYYQFSSGALSHVKTSQPALVVKYMKSMTARANHHMGDPDMTIVPPVSNMSTAYTLPVVDNRLVFEEMYVNILVHDQGISSLRVNGKPPQTRPIKIANTEWSYYNEWGSPGEWRIECDLPCFAETYGYGYADGYTFAGGGDFKYQDSLFGDVLDYRTVLIGRSKPLSGKISTGADLNLLTDSVTVYGLSWLTTSTDSSYFQMLDTLAMPIRLGPNSSIPIRFAFSPTEVREYRARAWVHSSSRALAYVDFVGIGGLMSVDIIPKEINFGRVRLDKDTSRNYSVLFSGEDNLAKVTLLPYGYANLQTPELGFNVPAIARSEHEAGTAYTSSVTFKPLTEGWRDTGFNVYALLPQKLQDTQKLHVRLIGRGVMPNVETEDEIFGDVRIDRFTAFREIEVRNLGSDTTQIVSIELDPDDSDFDDFTLDPSTIPSPERFLDTVGVDGSRITYRARFNPNDTGHKEIMVRIKTLEQTVYSKLTGRGVEPYIVATPPVLDFGVIDATIPGVDLSPEKTFSIANIGTYEGIVYNLRQTETGKEHFVLRPITPSETIVDEIVAMRGNVDVEVTFNAKRVGQFLDTVFIANDTRNQPFVILKGIVKTDIVITPTEVEFDTIRDCDPVIVTVRIDNPNTVGIEIDTVYFEGDTAGFSFAEVFNVDLIRIEAGSFFEINVKYIFPADRLSGDQTAKLVFYQYIGDAVVRREVILHLYRDIKTLSLTTVKPSYTPSASDAQLFRLPIKIVGEREGLEELDNFDLVLRFDNDLFEAVGVDLVGSLAEAPPGQVSRPIYDPVEKTYTITGRGLDVSKRKGDLLLTVLVETYLTVDTFATVTPELNLSQRPCAYGIAKQGVMLEYANDCGDELLRDKLRDEKAFKIVGVHPDPLVTSSSSTVNFNYVLGYDAELRGEVVSTSGMVLYQLPPIQAATGEGTLLVPASALPASGSYILRITQRPTSDPTANEQTFSRMFRVVR